MADSTNPPKALNEPRSFAAAVAKYQYDVIETEFSQRADAFDFAEDKPEGHPIDPTHFLTPLLKLAKTAKKEVLGQIYRFEERDQDPQRRQSNRPPLWIITNKWDHRDCLCLVRHDDQHNYEFPHAHSTWTLLVPINSAAKVCTYGIFSDMEEGKSIDFSQEEIKVVIVGDTFIIAPYQFHKITVSDNRDLVWTYQLYGKNIADTTQSSGAGRQDLEVITLEANKKTGGILKRLYVNPVNTDGKPLETDYVDVLSTLAGSDNRNQYLKSAVLSDPGAARLLATRLTEMKDYSQGPVLMIAKPIIGMTEAFLTTMLGGILANAKTLQRFVQSIEIVTGPAMRQSIKWFVERQTTKRRNGFVSGLFGRIRRVLTASRDKASTA